MTLKSLGFQSRFVEGLVKAEGQVLGLVMADYFYHHARSHLA